MGRWRSAANTPINPRRNSKMPNWDYASVTATASIVLSMASIIIAFLSFLLSKRTAQKGLPVITRIYARRRQKFLAVSARVAPGDQTDKIVGIYVPGCVVAPAYKKNDIPESCQMHLWDQPPKEQFKKELPVEIYLMPRSSSVEIKISVAPAEADEFELCLKLEGERKPIKRRFKSQG